MMARLLPSSNALPSSTRTDLEQLAHFKGPLGLCLINYLLSVSAESNGSDWVSP